MDLCRAILLDTTVVVLCFCSVLLKKVLKKKGRNCTGWESINGMWNPLTLMNHSDIWIWKYTQLFYQQSNSSTVFKSYESKSTGSRQKCISSPAEKEFTRETMQVLFEEEETVAVVTAHLKTNARLKQFQLEVTSRDLLEVEFGAQCYRWATFISYVVLFSRNYELHISECL